MKILVVLPWAPSATRPRSLGLIKHLAKHHEVSVVGAAWSKAEAEELNALPVDRVLPVRVKKWQAYWRCILGLFAGRSLQQSYVDAPNLRLAIRREFDSFHPDVAYFNVIRSAQFADECAGVPRIIDLDEFRSAYYDILSTTSGSFLWRLIARTESRRMRQAEAKVLDVFDRILVSSPTDLGSDRSRLRLVRSPHAIRNVGQTGEFPRTEGSIVFVGRQSYRANAEAVTWFVHEVLPKVMEKVPKAHLTIVGDAPSKKILRLAGPSVTVTGRVEDLAKYYSSASVSVIPVTMATGVQMKLIESMALGTPVVATPIVAGGAGVDERHCLVAESPDEWVNKVVALLTGEISSEELAASAGRWASEVYSAESIGAALDDVISELDDLRVESRVK